MVLQLLGAVAGFVKVRYLVDKAVIDNVAFRLHYRVTSGMLFLFCILCTANSFIGPPIACIPQKEADTKVLNTYCWVLSTYTLPDYHTHGEAVGEVAAIPGVRPERHHGEEKTYHAYYQWVPFMLFLQGLLFYVPHWLWKGWEARKVQGLSDGLRGAVTATTACRDHRRRVVAYVRDSLSQHTGYAAGYFACELLNLLVVVLNILLTDRFLSHRFLRYGLDYLGRGSGHTNTTAYWIFPRVTKCLFYKYGPTGLLQHYDSMCVLALNIINEKLYLFLWFWFLGLTVVSGLAVAYSLGLILSRGLRRCLLQHRFKYREPRGLDVIIDRTNVGDFLLLHLLGQNVTAMQFTDMMDELSKELLLRDGQSHGQATPIYGQPPPSLYPAKDGFMPM